VSTILFGVPASHPSLAAELMLRRKGIDYTRIDLAVAVHRGMGRGLGFPRGTVPALRLDGARVQGTRDISPWIAVPSGKDAGRSSSRPAMPRVTPAAIRLHHGAIG
jgi:hypothetical protein